MNTYSWYLFDADGTLLDYPAAEARALEETARRFGLAVNDEIRGVYHRINTALWALLEQGRISSEELRWRRFEQLAAECGWNMDARRFSSDYLEELAEGGFMISGARTMLERLLGGGRAEGRGGAAAGAEAAGTGRVRAAVVTNGLREVQYRRLEKAGIRHLFEEVIVSEDAPAAKPDEAYFDYALGRIGFFRKDEILVIGDSLSSDIAGAAAFGLDSCWFNPEGRENTGPWSPSFEIGSWEEFFTVVPGFSG